MKIKYLYKLLIVAFVAIQLVACSNGDTEEKFNETPTARTNAESKKLDDLLLSSEYGWKAVYFTDNTQLGGYTHLFKFSPGGKVTMASDFDSDTKKHDSQYEIQLGSTVSLVFTTANRIHLLSDSNSYPTKDLKGQGYLGDFQFLFYGEDKGDIVFRTNRKFEELRFIKATAADWANLSKNILMKGNVIGADTRSLFRFLETNDGTAVNQFDFNFNDITRFATADPIAAGLSKSFNVGIGYSPTGIIVSPAIEIKGQALSEFVYNDADGSFTANGTNGVSATIKYSNKPLVLTEDYKILLNGQPSSDFGYYEVDVTKVAPTNSILFKNEIKKINASLPAGAIIIAVELYFNHSKGNFIKYLFSDGGSIFHYVNVKEDPINKTLILTHKSWNGNVANPTPAFLADFDNYFLDAKGIYVNKESFRLYYTNTVYTFTSASSPFRMTTWKN
ncbi:DUF4302 domain-containing protein [Flavobacterium sp. ALJ2]|uniref:DUF4302 domain-containing protein n=1 Tax=Flavobacterium sp. ALJ2 TaxID=2786960 RepID=UPI00189F3E7B|nr:DUF4302 domain-containing protein [Flavobacterium sp. ALJ2]MBF7093062.1 DUF4302 domain-containing protein [Flavobacterium sp. ALJ2]